MTPKRIEKNKKYRVKGKNEYFLKQYGTYNPIIQIIDHHTDAYKRGWISETACPACIRFAARVHNAFRDFPIEDVWLGEIGYPEELVQGNELEEISS